MGSKRHSRLAPKLSNSLFTGCQTLKAEDLATAGRAATATEARETAKEACMVGCRGGGGEEVAEGGRRIDE